MQTINAQSFLCIISVWSQLLPQACYSSVDATSAATVIDVEKYVNDYYKEPRYHADNRNQKLKGLNLLWCVCKSSYYFYVFFLYFLNF